MKAGIGALRADEALGGGVELLRRDARADLALDQLERADEDVARRGHLVDLLWRLLDDHSVSSRRSVASTARTWSWTSVGAARAVDAAQQAALVVVGDERLGLGVVDLEPLLDDLRLVVVALDEARAVDVAAAFVLRRIGLDVVHAAGLDAHAPPGDAPHEILVGHVEQQHRGDAAAELVERLAERVGLRARAREAVEDEAVARVVGADAVDDQVDHELVRHELAGVHEALRLQPQLGAVLDGRAQDVAGRHVRQPEVFLQAGGLRALARRRAARRG